MPGACWGFFSRSLLRAVGTSSGGGKWLAACACGCSEAAPAVARPFSPIWPRARKALSLCPSVVLLGLAVPAPPRVVVVVLAALVLVPVGPGCAASPTRTPANGESGAQRAGESRQ